MQKTKNDAKTFKYLPHACYFTGMTFQQCNSPSENIAEEKSYSLENMNFMTLKLEYLSGCSDCAWGVRETLLAVLLM